MKRRKLAFYIRLSDADEDVRKGIKDESNSITGQRALLSFFVRQNKEFDDYEIREYFDDGFSGTGFNDREQFQKMLEDAKTGVFDCLIVKDFSRLGRDYLEVGNYMEFIFPALGLRFISVNDHYDSDRNCGMTGGMDVAFKNLIYQMYSRDLSTKVKAARRNRNQNGEFTGSFAKYGYRKDPHDKHKLIIDEQTAPYVREIFKLVASGMTTGEVARLFNKRRVPTRILSQREKSNYKPVHDKGDYLWEHTEVFSIIRDEAYIGKLIQNKKEIKGFGDNKRLINKERPQWVIIEGGLPQIVSEELFEEANKAIRRLSRAIKPIYRVNLFFCPYCGRKLRGSRREGYYTCKVKTMDSSKTCAKIRFKRQEAEKIVTEKVIEACTTHLKDEAGAGVQVTIEQAAKHHPDIEDEMKMLEDNIISLYKQYKCGRMTKDQYLLSRQELRDKINLLEVQKEQVATEKTEKPCDKKSVWMRILEQAKEGFDGSAFSEIIEQVMIYADNRVEVIFREDTEVKKD